MSPSVMKDGAVFEYMDRGRTRTSPGSEAAMSLEGKVILVTGAPPALARMQPALRRGGGEGSHRL